MIVMKFGGTSVATHNNIQRIKSIIEQTTEPCLVVVSAISKATDQLLEIADKSLSNEYQPLINNLKQRHFDLIEELFGTDNVTRIKDHVSEHIDQLTDICHSIYVIQERSNKILARIQSFGELMSSYILREYFTQKGLQIDWIDSRKMIRANGRYERAYVDVQETKRLMSVIDQSRNYIAGGFIATNEKGETTLLGRGGSDYSAALYASCIKASKLEIWSDVSGMQNANPRVVKEAGPIKEMSYKEAFEMAFFGAKVLYPPTIKPVMENDIPLFLKNTFHPEQEGTFISKTGGYDEEKIKGVSSLPNISIINISGIGLAKEKGTARRVFQALEEANVNVILITQSCSEQSICLGLNANDTSAAVASIKAAFETEIATGLFNKVEINEDQCIIAVIGDNMKSTVGLSGKMFSALGKNGINIRAIAQGASERNISLVVDKKDEDKAINIIHQKFFQEAIKKVHLYIAGVGNVGKQFLEVIKKQRKLLLEQNKVDIKIVGVINSTKMLHDPYGLTDYQIDQLSEEGNDYSDFDQFIDKAIDDNYYNSIFIDNTASQIVSDKYKKAIEASISVVACNKIACSSSYTNYINLVNTAREKNCAFKYETAVGAALPIINTIQDIMLSGDHINRIQAVLSGSLNFIFNKYDASTPFADIVKQAKDEGYTEPNPLLDLGGTDVMRKILILSREAGYIKEMSDVSFNGFLPESVANAKNNEEMFAEMLKHESHFAAIYNKAHQAGNRLKVVAELNEGALSVELKEVSPDSPFYHLEGKDNIVAMHTNRYINEPIIIKGAGAGAEITASGVFSDVMKVINV